MAQTVPQHAHCNMCGKSIPYGEVLCSEECKQKYQKILRQKKISWYLTYGVIAAAIVWIVLFYGK